MNGCFFRVGLSQVGWVWLSSEMALSDQFQIVRRLSNGRLEPKTDKALPGKKSAILFECKWLTVRRVKVERTEVSLLLAAAE